MYTLEIMKQTETSVTAKLIPMKEKRYYNSDGEYVIEYTSSSD